ncbi:MAG: methionyl-tRNA formyltransferase [Gammaproteobacteria bacterium]|nr:MAG: methionyl-tRNA formyltransferase [Pseudomonadota bacterium]PIE38356.1 MAG: methionyl-tRNA formyltransferase [Gammaproteobacteria bacterium]
MKILFAGTPEFAATSLSTLINANQHQVCAVYTQPDRPAGRGRKQIPGPVKTVATEHAIPVLQPVNFKSAEAVATLAAFEPDLMVVAAYGLILPQAVLDTPKLGCINIHASLLPRWRGAAPIQRAIEAGDEETGITIMQMDAGLDTGAMMLKKPVAIEATDTGGTLHDKLARLGGECLLDALDRIQRGTIKPEAQDDSQASYAHKLNKEDGRIDWHQGAREIERKIRAFNPWPVAFTEQNGTRIRVFEATANDEPGHTAAPGTVIRRDKKGIAVACGQGTVTITRLQLPGNKAITALDLINGGQPVLPVQSALDPVDR